MNRALPVALLLALAALDASGQTLRFKNGRSADLSKARVAGDQIALPADAANPGAGEILLPVSSIERIDWPEPAELAQGSAALKAGKPEDALKKTDAVVARQEPFRDIPGSWWAKAILLRVEILARLGRDADAEAAAERLRLSPLGAPLASQARLSLIDMLVASGKRDLARERLDALSAAASGDKALAARADLVRARLLQAEGKTEDALLSYLRVPVLYPSQNGPAPAALLGAAECYRALGENIRAETALRSLIERFPDSAEAARARPLLPSS